MFTFTPLLGAQTTSPALQSLLEFDGGIKILIDVGWDESFDSEKLKELERQVPTISFILLTHATISHLGAYAHCCKHIPLFIQIPVYATTPVISLGRTLTQDLYDSTPLAASSLPQSSFVDSAYSFSAFDDGAHSKILLPPPTNEDIAGYFSLINSLKYSQLHQPLPSPFSPPLEGLTITAYCAGHTLGGTIWHIQHSSESVVYAVDWSQARENVLPGAAWLGGSGATGAEIIEQLRKPTALICSSKGSEVVALPGGLKRRDEILLDHIRTIIREGGNVLIPCDSSARVLELAYVLERAWAAESEASASVVLQKAKLYLASSTCESTMKYARSMLEWMEEGIVREFEALSTKQAQGRDAKRLDSQNVPQQPFAFKHLKMLERKSQLTRSLASEGPKVFLASHSSLNWGFSKTILLHIASDRKNLVLLTSPLMEQMQSEGTEDKGIFDTLISLLRREKKGSTHQCSDDRIAVREVYTAALSGKDLSIYQQHLVRQRQRQNTFNADKATKLESSADVVDEESSSSSSSDDDSDPEHQGKALNVSATLAHSKHKLVDLTDDDLGINVLLRRKNVHDYDVRGRKGREKVFPFVARRRRVDDFGDLIRPEEYLRAEERDEVDGQDMRREALTGDSALGQKRKWDEKDIGLFQGRRRSSGGLSKKRKLRDDPSSGNQDIIGTNGATDNDEESEESDYEPAEPILRGPTKATFSIRELELNLKIAILDFSGIHDRRSLHMLIPLIRPRKLILTGGNEKETLSFAEDCRKMLAASEASTSKMTDDDVLTPIVGSSVDASVDTNAWTIKLSQSFFKRLHWQTFRGLGIVTIHGRLVLPDPASAEVDEEKVQKRVKIITTKEPVLPDTADKRSQQQPSNPPILTELPESTIVPRPVSQALHVGDLRLAELRKIMQANGHAAEFKGEGTLLIDGMIAVRKSGIGRIEVENGGHAHAGASFFSVKRQIYEGLAVVAAR